MDSSPAPRETRRSPLPQLLGAVAIVLLLQIPALFVMAISSERGRSRSEAAAEISDSWGRPQSLAGPYLVVPYTVTATTKDAQGVERPRTSTYLATALPRELRVEGRLSSEVRRRGIFESPVYIADLTFEGSFDPPDLRAVVAESGQVDWSRARIAVEVSDARAIRESVVLRWAGAEAAFQPGVGSRQAKRAGIHVPLAAAGVTGPWTEAQTFSFRLTANGSERLRLAPLGGQTRVALSSDWPSPSFRGAWLPTEREVGDGGFSAVWSIPDLGRNYPGSWVGDADEAAIEASMFGVDLATPVDVYRQTERSLKYSILFIGLTFGVVWFFELLGGARVHLMQYLSIGAALCMFYLLELSLSEHLPYALAYFLAAAPVVVLIGVYSRAALGSIGRAVAVSGAAALLYAYLYFILSLEDYALLAGSLLLFAVLAAAMLLTRHVDWSSGARRAA